MAKKLWGGRFKKKIDKDFFEFQKSIQYDARLAQEDIVHSLLHVTTLKNAGLLTKIEAQKLISALKRIKKQINENKFKPDINSEDIHTAVQNEVGKITGKTAQKLHTLRSRNDQVVFDEKLYCNAEALDIEKYLAELLISLKFLSGRHKAVKIAGYTHTQKAQPIFFRDYIGAYISMFNRDKKRLSYFSKNLVFYIGSGAIRGTFLTKKYDKAAKELAQKLGINIAVVNNAPDNVSDRDFIIEFLSILSILQMHLSRLAEDFILYSTKEFDYFSLPEEFCTGSSLMPHKKNPDFLELVRGYTGRIYGSLFSLLTTMKGLPLTYNRDMQLDKEPLFSSVDIVRDEVKILAKFIKGIKLNNDAIKKSLEDDGLYAVDIVEHLVKQKISFKEAHDAVGKLIRYCEDKNCKIKDLNDNQLKKISPYLKKDVIHARF